MCLLLLTKLAWVDVGKTQTQTRRNEKSFLRRNLWATLSSPSVQEVLSAIEKISRVRRYLSYTLNSFPFPFSFSFHLSRSEYLKLNE